MKQIRASTYIKHNKRSPVGFQKPAGSKRASALQQTQFLRYIQKKEKPVQASALSTQPDANRPPHLERANILQKVHKKAFKKRMKETAGFSFYGIDRLEKSIEASERFLISSQSLWGNTPCCWWAEMEEYREKAKIKADSLRIAKLQKEERLEEEKFAEEMARCDEKIARSKALFEETVEKNRLRLEERSRLEKEKHALESLSEEELQMVQMQERKEIQEQYDKVLQTAYEEAFQKQLNMFSFEFFVRQWKTTCEMNIADELTLRSFRIKYDICTALDIEIRIVRWEAEIDACIAKLEQFEERPLIRELKRRPFLEKWGRPWEWENPFEGWREWMQPEPVMNLFNVIPSLTITPL